MKFNLAVDQKSAKGEVSAEGFTFMAFRRKKNKRFG